MSKDLREKIKLVLADLPPPVTVKAAYEAGRADGRAAHAPPPPPKPTPPKPPNRPSGRFVYRTSYTSWRKR